MMTLSCVDGFSNENVITSNAMESEGANTNTIISSLFLVGQTSQLLLSLRNKNIHNHMKLYLVLAWRYNPNEKKNTRKSQVRVKYVSNLHGDHTSLIAH